jgi:hypothetical protein
VFSVFSVFSVCVCVYVCVCVCVCVCLVNVKALNTLYLK